MSGDWPVIVPGECAADGCDDRPRLGVAVYRDEGATHDAVLWVCAMHGGTLLVMHGMRA